MPQTQTTMPAFMPPSPAPSPAERRTQAKRRWYEAWSHMLEIEEQWCKAAALEAKLAPACVAACDREAQRKQQCTQTLEQLHSGNIEVI